MDVLHKYFKITAYKNKYTILKNLSLSILHLSNILLSSIDGWALLVIHRVRIIYHSWGMVRLWHHWWTTRAILTCTGRTPVLVWSTTSTEQSLSSHACCVTADEVVMIACLHYQILMVLVVHIRCLSAAGWLHCLS